MMRITFIMSILVLSVWAAPTLETMKKEERVALVIGNSNYDGHPLTAPIQNARKIRGFLEKSGFYVYYGENLDKRNLIHLLRKFNRGMHPGGIGLVYFSGHIVQAKGKNFLVPVESGIHKEAMITRQCVSLKSIYSGMKNAHNRLNIVILDNDKNRPFGSLFTMKEQSLAPITYLDDFSTFIASYPGTANDSDTFTEDFLHFAERKGLELRELRSELTCHRQLQKQPKPRIDLAKNRPFYFNLPTVLPSSDEEINARTTDNTPINGVDGEAADAREQKCNEFEAKAAEETRKRQEEARKVQAAELKAVQAKKSAPAVAETGITKRDKAASDHPSPKPEAKVQKNVIGITLSEPGSESKVRPKKPTEGQERHILLQ